MEATIQRFLEDFQFVKLVFQKGQEEPELLKLLFELFDNHGKSSEFVRNIANDEVTRAGFSLESRFHFTFIIQIIFRPYLKDRA